MASWKLTPLAKLGNIAGHNAGGGEFGFDFVVSYLRLGAGNTLAGIGPRKNFAFGAAALVSRTGLDGAVCTYPRKVERVRFSERLG